MLCRSRRDYERASWTGVQTLWLETGRHDVAIVQHRLLRMYCLQDDDCFGRRESISELPRTVFGSLGNGRYRMSYPAVESVYSLASRLWLANSEFGDETKRLTSAGN